MTQNPTLDFNAKDSFYDLKIEQLSLKEITFNKKIFENCTFRHCDFSHAKFLACKFVDCVFDSCNLASIDIHNSAFNDVTFEKSKVIGINWARAKWPLINLCSPIKFYQSNLNDSSFFELELIEIVMQECKVHNVDFRGANLSRGSFILSDLQNSLFSQTNLTGADFTDAYDYNIHSNENKIKHAKFSFPEVLSLLNHFDIEISGI